MVIQNPEDCVPGCDFVEGRIYDIKAISKSTKTNQMPKVDIHCQI